MLPFAFGQAFRKGDIPSGTRVAGAGTGLLEFEADVRNRWPDGSVKFAVLSGSVTLSAGQRQGIDLYASSAAAPTTSTLTLANLKASNVTAALAFGSSTASWAGTDWDSPHRTIQSGTTMSSWVYRKPLGSDAHLVAWLEVRVYRNGQVEVLPWIENGYVSVAGSATKRGRATFSLNGTLRYDSANDSDHISGYAVTVVAGGLITLTSYCRAVLVSGGIYSHWSGTDPRITPQHARSYLESTRLIPGYRPAAIGSSTLAALTKNYSPMRTTYLNEAMGVTGFEEGIGLLPNQSAMYVVSGDARAYNAVLASGFSLGSYCIHYRDQNTNLTLRFADWVNTSTNSGGTVLARPTDPAPYRYAQSHHPAAAYLPYLLTGWNWFVDELQFQVTLNYLSEAVSRRAGANYFVNDSMGQYGGNNQGGPRGIAWSWRTLAMAATCTPDADSSRAQLIAALNYNATQYRRIHETGTGDLAMFAFAPNNLGVVYEPGFPGNVGTNGQLIGATWQDDFVTMSIGLTWDMEVITDATAKADLKWFRDFKYKAIVGRLGAQNDPSVWNHRDAAPYNIFLGTPNAANRTMAWHATWGDAYRANYDAVNGNNLGQAGAPDNLGQSGNTLRRGFDGGGLTTSYWGNLQPAISYAVEHGATGAAEAYARLVNAPNFTSNALTYESLPVWGVKPRGL